MMLEGASYRYAFLKGTLREVATFLRWRRLKKRIKNKDSDMNHYCVIWERFRVTDTQTGSSAAPSYTSADLRDRLEHLVIADLLGPVGGSEEIVDERSV